MGLVMRQYDIVLVNLDPTVGHEIQKTRPCVLISPDEMNQHIGTIIIAPMTTKTRAYPTRAAITFEGKSGAIVLDQIRAIDKRRVIKTLGKLQAPDIAAVKRIIREMLVD